MKRTLRSFIMISVVFFIACGEKSASDSDSSPEDKEDAGTETADIPAPAAGTGQLVFSIPDDVDGETVAGYVVGSQDTLKVKKAGDTYYVNDIPPGQTDIIVTAGSLQIAALTAESDRAVRKNGLSVKADESKALDTLDVPVAGSISGVVTLSGLSNHAGIDVYIPGTSYTAKTDKEGKFSMGLVPVGTHELYMESDSFQRAEVSGIDVNTDANTAIDDVVLKPKSGPVGSLSINDGAKSSTNLTVNVHVEATEGALFMRYGENENQLPAAYETFASDFEYTFTETTFGEATLYLQIKDKDGLESLILSATIDLQVESEVVLEAPLNLNATPSGTEMIDLAWQPVDNAEGYVVLVQQASISDVLTDGTSLSVGDTVGSAEVAYVGTDTGFSHTGLLAGTTYYYKVFASVQTTKFGPASDEASATTETGALRLFATAAKHLCGALDNRTGIENQCQTDAPAGCNNVGAFVSTSTRNLNDLHNEYGFDADRQVIGESNGEVVFNAFSDVGTLLPAYTMQEATGITDKWWTGSDMSGVHSFSAGDWAGSTFAEYGTHDSTTVLWLDDGQSAAACTIPYYFLCLCY